MVVNNNLLKQDFYEYTNWYVLHVRPKMERFYIDCISKLNRDDIRMLSFSKEVLHKKKHREEKVSMPLFPGYLFVHERIDDAVTFLQKYFPHEYIRPVTFNNEKIPVKRNEMYLLLKNSDDCGKFKLSNAYKTGDSFVIVDGPLKDINGEILFINEKKKKAKVKLSLFNQELEISLGLDLIKQKRREPVLV